MGKTHGLHATIHDLSSPVTGSKERLEVATISAHNDPRIGELVADAVEKVGGEGVITVEEAKVDGDLKTGLRILRKALEVPARQIGENSGLDGGVVAEKMRVGAGNVGLDASRGVYVDLVAAGIIDPTKVVRLTLENAISLAGTLLLAEATVTEEPEKAHANEPQLAEG
jgi:chaperonin GroEL